MNIFRSDRSIPCPHGSCRGQERDEEISPILLVCPGAVRVKRTVLNVILKNTSEGVVKLNCPHAYLASQKL